jgi:uncharacterized protein (DUF58 family)
MLIPTRRFWGLVFLGIPLALVGAVVPGFERVLIPYNLGLLIALLGTAWLTPKADKLSLRRKFDNVLSVRMPNRVELSLENLGRMGVTGRLREAPPEFFFADRVEFAFDLDEGGYQTLSYHITPYERGEEFFGDFTVRLLAPLGLVEVERVVAGREAVRVYPNVLALREFDLLRQRGKLSLIGIRKTRIRGQGTEFESLRDYHDDDYRRIDWKSTARRGKLVVRDYETERNQSVIVCVDIGRNMLAEVDGVTKLDHVLDASLMLIHAASSNNDLTGLLVFSDRVVNYVVPRKGRGHSASIIDAVHDLQPEVAESDYQNAFSYLASRYKRRSLVVIFTDAEETQQARRLREGLTALKRHLVFVARVSDARIKELVSREIVEDRDVFTKAAALWYTNERQRAEMVLQSGGVRSIDAEPEELAQALVSAYLIVKETAAL